MALRRQKFIRGEPADDLIAYSQPGGPLPALLSVAPAPEPVFVPAPAPAPAPITYGSAQYNLATQWNENGQYNPWDSILANAPQGGAIWEAAGFVGEAQNSAAEQVSSSATLSSSLQAWIADTGVQVGIVDAQQQQAALIGRDGVALPGTSYSFDDIGDFFRDAVILVVAGVLGGNALQAVAAESAAAAAVTDGALTASYGLEAALQAPALFEPLAFPLAAESVAAVGVLPSYVVPVLEVGAYGAGAGVVDSFAAVEAAPAAVQPYEAPSFVEQLLNPSPVGYEAALQAPALFEPLAYPLAAESVAAVGALPAYWAPVLEVAAYGGGAAAAAASPWQAPTLQQAATTARNVSTLAGVAEQIKNAINPPGQLAAQARPGQGQAGGIAQALQGLAQSPAGVLTVLGGVAALVFFLKD